MLFSTGLARGIHKLISRLEKHLVFNRDFCGDVTALVALGYTCDLTTDCTDEVYNVVDMFLIPTCSIFKILSTDFYNGAVTEIITIYPRKGTETYTRLLSRVSIIISTYPRKGTETLSSTSLSRWD